MFAVYRRTFETLDAAIDGVFWCGATLSEAVVVAAEAVYLRRTAISSLSKNRNRS